MEVSTPKTLDLFRAGAIPTTGLTALQGVDDALHLRRGESVIIHGASGGVGTLAPLQVVIAAAYPLDQAERAHARLAKGHMRGKVVLRIRSGRGRK